VLNVLKVTNPDQSFEYISTLNCEPGKTSSIGATICCDSGQFLPLNSQICVNGKSLSTFYAIFVIDNTFKKYVFYLLLYYRCEL
jgi:hypothetical protein